MRARFNLHCCSARIPISRCCALDLILQQPTLTDNQARYIEATSQNYSAPEPFFCPYYTPAFRKINRAVARFISVVLAV